MTGIEDHPLVELEITRSTEGDDTVLTLIGELDIATAPDLQRALGAVATSGRVVVDLSRLSFMDSTGLAALIAADENIVAAGHALVLWRPSPQVRRLFELTGILQRLTVLDELR